MVLVGAPRALNTLGALLGFPKLGVPILGRPNNKDCSVLGSVLGSCYLKKLPLCYSAGNLHPKSR